MSIRTKIKNSSIRNSSTSQNVKKNIRDYKPEALIEKILIMEDTPTKLKILNKLDDILNEYCENKSIKLFITHNTDKLPILKDMILIESNDIIKYSKSKDNDINSTININYQNDIKYAYLYVNGIAGKLLKGQNDFILKTDSGIKKLYIICLDIFNNYCIKKYKINISDKPPNPIIQCPDNININNDDDKNNANLHFDISAYSELDGKLEYKCSHKSPYLFPIGSTQVKCSTIDSFGQFIESSFTVTVNPTQCPKIICQSEYIITATSLNGVHVDLEKLIKIESPFPPIKIDTNLNRIFNIGDNNIKIKVIDNYGNISTYDLNVKIINPKPPIINCPNDIITNNDDNCNYAIVNYNVEAISFTDSSLDIICDPCSGSKFPIGKTTVYCQTIDLFGQKTEKYFNVIVNLTPIKISNYNNNSVSTILRKTIPINILVKGGSGNYGSNWISINGSISDIDILSCNYTSQKIGQDMLVYQIYDKCDISNYTYCNIIFSIFEDLKIKCTHPSSVLVLNSKSNINLGIYGGVPPYNCIWKQNSDHFIIDDNNYTNPSIIANNIGETAINVIVSDNIGNTQESHLKFNIVPDLSLFCKPDDCLIQIGQQIMISSTVNLGGLPPYSYCNIIEGDSIIIVNDSPNSLIILGKNPGISKITRTVTDSISNKYSCIINVKVLSSNQPPLLETIQTSTFLIGDTINIPLKCKGDDPIIYSTSVLPQGLSFDSSNGIIHGILSSHGTYNVICNATNINGTSQNSFNIAVIPKPDLQLPNNIIVDSDSINGSIVLYPFPITNSNGMITCIPNSGSTFPIGSTNINCKVIDSYNQITSGIFTITVRGYSETLFNIFNNIQFEIKQISSTDILNYLNQLLSSLNFILSNDNWIDINTLNSDIGSIVFDHLISCIDVLRKMLVIGDQNDDNIILNNSFIVNTIENIIKVTILIVESQLSIVILSGGKTRKIQESQNILEISKIQFNHGKWFISINNLKSSWIKSIESIN